MAVVHVLANPASGRASQDDHQRVSELLRARGHEVVDLTGDAPDRSREAVVAAVEAGAERLVVVGGDGLVHLAVGAIGTSGVVIGLVPQGTGNDFARALGLGGDGDDLTSVVDAALSDPVAVDLLRTSAGDVATVATLGFAGDVTGRANRMRWPRGERRYTVATILELPRLRTLSLRLVVDGVEHRVDTVMLSVGNTAYFGGGMKICPGAHPADGCFQVAIIEPVSRLTLLRVFPKVYDGTHIDHPKLTMLTGSRIEIAGADVTVWGDGEPLGPLPVTMEILPGALQIASARV